jgi:hypothetical protein
MKRIECSVKTKFGIDKISRTDITFPNLGELHLLGSPPETLLLEFLGRVREAHLNRSLYDDELQQTQVDIVKDVRCNVSWISSQV